MLGWNGLCRFRLRRHGPCPELVWDPRAGEARGEGIDPGQGEPDVTERDAGTEKELPAGIVIHGTEEKEPKPPLITAFIWGGKVRQEPTLPFGRWKVPAV